jgi:3-deoxy-7-phosphoheptulonate synthase
VTQIPERQEVAITDAVGFGPGTFVVAAGPCAVEGREQLLTTARTVAAAGAALLRGGAFKPRSSPRSFQGLGAEGLRYLAEASAATGLPVVTEVLDPRQLELVSEHAAMLQIGSRNMQNFALLREVGQLRKPVLLKRGAAATLDELLSAADYILEEGNPDIVLCERGVRCFDPSTRYLLDLSAVPLLQSRSPLPVVVDPSHGTGRQDLVLPMVRAALAVGADGVMVEVHPEPQAALSDGPQALLPDDFSALMNEIRRWIPPTGRYLAGLGSRFPGGQPETSKARAT